MEDTPLSMYSYWPLKTPTRSLLECRYLLDHLFALIWQKQTEFWVIGSKYFALLAFIQLIRGNTDAVLDREYQVPLRIACNFKFDKASARPVQFDEAAVQYWIVQCSPAQPLGLCKRFWFPKRNGVKYKTSLAVFWTQARSDFYQETLAYACLISYSRSRCSCAVVYVRFASCWNVRFCRSTSLSWDPLVMQLHCVSVAFHCFGCV